MLEQGLAASAFGGPGAERRVNVVGIGDHLGADDPASNCVRAALAYTPTIAETIWWDSDESGDPDQATLDWLLELGVLESAGSPIAIRTARVGFDGFGRYAPAVVGDFAFILPVLDAEGLCDLAAWAPRTGELGTRLGVGALLGGEQIGRDTGDGVTVPPLPIFRSPIEWLRARRRGGVIVDSSRAALALAGVVIEVPDEDHAAELRHTLRVPAPIVSVRRPAWVAA